MRFRSKRYLVLLIAAVVPVLTLTFSGAFAGATGPSSSTAADPVVKTESGLVRGASTQVVRSGSAQRFEQFLGVPYAAPPLRELRFAPPEDVEPWQGVRDATRQEPACIQFEPSGVREEQAVSEDCLYIDIYRPANVKRDRLPVMVWFHGGANTQGTGVIYGGGTMAARTDTIVISVNYRLGAFGFLAHPGLTADEPAGVGNFGRLDQLKVLKWVRDNIANFGGDAGNVTIYGQSAGGQAVCDMMAAPSAEGLFHKAVVQSQHCFFNRATLERGERLGLEYAEAVGCADEATAVECLRKAWPGTLVAHQRIVRGGSKVGTEFLPKTFAEALDDGTWNAVPVMTGTTRSENRLTGGALAGITEEEYEALVRETYGDKAEEVLELYPVSEFKSPWDAITQLQTDERRACSNDEFAQAVTTEVPTYRYEFNDPTSPTLYGFRVPGEDMSNGHSAELAYLFDFTLGEGPLTKEQEKLAEQMMRYWGAFAHGGAPNFKGAPDWPTYGADHNVLQLRQEGASEVINSFEAEHNCSFWRS